MLSSNEFVKIWKQKPALSIGIGALGVLALVLRYKMRRAVREPIPETISPAIFATRVVRTRCGEMIYHVSGSGEPIVFLHGVFLGASSYEWSKIYPKFVPNHEVIVPDLIGFGESERPATPMNPVDYVEALADFLREVAPARKPIVVASGFTAGMSLLLAARYPDIISHLILFLPTSLKESGQWRSIGMLALSQIPGVSRFIYRNYLARPPGIRRWLTRIALVDPTMITDEMVTIFSTCAQQYGAEHTILGFLRGRHTFNIDHQLSEVNVPVHILWPDRASGFSSDGGEAICRKIPHASLEILSGCGILAPLENPNLVETAISQSL